MPNFRRSARKRVFFLLFILLFRAHAFAPAASADANNDYFCKEPLTPFFKVKRSLPGGGKIMKSVRSGAIPSQFRLPKPQKLKRVFMLGESVAALLYPPRLAHAISSAFPPRKFEVINTGMGAYASTRISMIFREILEYEPDLIILLSGNNETYSGRFGMCPGIFQRINEKLRRWDFYEDIQDWIHARKKTGIDPEDGRSNQLRSFELNLRNMIRAAKSRKVPFILCTLPANLRDYAPYGQAPFSEKIYADAWVQYERGNMAAAAGLFRDFLKQKPRDPFGHFFLARCLESLGRIPESREYYRQALEWDTRGDRCSPSKNSLIRKIGREEGVYIADLEKTFESTTQGGLVGDSVIADGVHWFRRFNPLVLRNIVDTIEGFAPTDRKRATGTLSRKGKSRKVDLWELAHPKITAKEHKMDTKTSLLYGLVEIQRWNGWDKNGEISERALIFLERINRRDKRHFKNVLKSDPEDTVLKISRKTFWDQSLGENVHQWWPVYLQHLAELYRRRGDAERSLPFFNKAIRLAPKRYLMRLYRGLALASLGEKEKALEDFNSLRRYQPEHPEIIMLMEAYGIRQD